MDDTSPTFAEQVKRTPSRISFSDYAKGVRRKLEHTFPSLAANPSPEMAAFRDTLRSGNDAYLASLWNYSKTAAGETLPPLTEQQQFALKETVRAIMDAFTDGLMLAKHVDALFGSKLFAKVKPTEIKDTDSRGKANLSRRIYRDSSTAKNAMDLYFNFTTLDAMERFKSFGYGEEQSYRNCGKLINIIMDNKENCELQHGFSHVPSHIYPKHDFKRTSGDNLAEVKRYTQARLDDLLHAYDALKMIDGMGR